MKAMKTLTPAARRLHLPLGSLLGVLLLLSSLIGLAACGASNADGKIHLTMWYWNRSIDDSLIAKVSQQFPNVVLQAEKITDYDTKVRTSMAGHSGIPDILGINSNISTYFPDEDQFVDLRTLGADEVKSEYLPWKWSLGISPDGKMIGFPMDTGPTALFYRTDLFAKAGLPTDPTQVTAQIRTWDDYLQAAGKMKNVTQGKSFMIDNITSIFNQMLAQNPKQYFDRSGHYIANQQYMRQIWDEAVKTAQLNVDGKVPMWTATWNQDVSNGYIASFIGAVWMKQILQDAAPDTKGKWHIARAPGGDGNNGGSFMAVTSASAHPKEAFEVIKWLQSPHNQLIGYQDLQLYPSAIAAIDDPAMHQQEPFYGNEDTTNIFAPAAKNVPLSYMSPYDGIVGSPFSDQLSLVDFQNKNGEQAWNDAQQEAQRQLLR